jgi:hypothetical protein
METTRTLNSGAAIVLTHSRQPRLASKPLDTLVVRTRNMRRDMLTNSCNDVTPTKRIKYICTRVTEDKKEGDRNGKWWNIGEMLRAGGN